MEEIKAFINEIKVAHRAKSYKFAYGYDGFDKTTKFGNLNEYVFISPNKKTKLIIRGDGKAYKTRNH